MLTTKTIFDRKAPGFDLREYSIVAIETLPHNEYTKFSGNLLQDYDFIADRKDTLGMGDEGSIHALLVMDSGGSDGILVYSSGYSYPQYSAFMPNIKPYINSQILQLADFIIRDGTKNTPNGRCVVGFDELGERFGVTVSPDNGIGQMLVCALKRVYTSATATERTLTKTSRRRCSCLPSQRSRTMSMPHTPLESCFSNPIRFKGMWVRRSSG